MSDQGERDCGVPNPDGVWALLEIEGGEGNGVVHWYCCESCRCAETADYGEVYPIVEDSVPEGCVCETCGASLPTQDVLVRGAR